MLLCLSFSLLPSSVFLADQAFLYSKTSRADSILSLLTDAIDGVLPPGCVPPHCPCATPPLPASEPHGLLGKGGKRVAGNCREERRRRAGYAGCAGRPCRGGGRTGGAGCIGRPRRGGGGWSSAGAQGDRAEERRMVGGGGGSGEVGRASRGEEDCGRRRRCRASEEE